MGVLVLVLVLDVSIQAAIATPATSVVPWMRAWLFQPTSAL